MAITLGSEGLSDAELTDGIGRGDVEAAAGLWVRYWPTALTSARQFVEADEVPGLAAEALIGTIAAISVGRGPREDLSSFVTAAVAELGESDVPPQGGGAPVPDVFVSPLMTKAFAGLSAEDQAILSSPRTEDQSDDAFTEARLGALTALQRDYLAEHIEHADDDASQQAHAAFAAAVTRSAPIGGATWVHTSECAWCTEAFHELAFSNVALDALVDPSAVAPVPVVPETVVPAAAVVAAETSVEPLFDETPAEPVTEPVSEPVSEHVSEHVSEPVSEPEPDDGHAVLAAPVGLLRRRRTKLVGGALLAAAAVTAALLVVTGPDDSTSNLSSLGSEQTQDEDAPAPTASDSVAPPVAATTSPTPSPAAATPTTAPVSAPAARPTPQALPSSTPRPTQAPSPTPTPTPKPNPTTASPSPAPSTPPATPAPTPTPTPTCDPWSHFFGLC